MYEQKGAGDVEEDPTGWDDLFVQDVDDHPVRFVKPADTDGPTWTLYQDEVYLGTVSAHPDGHRPRWRIHATGRIHHDLADAVRALRGPVF